MSQEIEILAISAISLGFLHTLLGPDHYIPFVAMAKAGNWSKFKTIWITVLSGIGHVLGSVLLGLLGIALGVALNIVEEIESLRGLLAGWALISFGIVYFVWAIRRLIKNKSHTHLHVHPDGKIHSHGHNHSLDHAHIHDSKNGSQITPWVLFIIFVLGPCEALIPLLIYPAANIGIGGIIIVILLFAAATLITMLGMVLISLYGIDYIPINKFEKYSHVMAGLIIIFSGLGIQLLGL
jgi:nickel/cobalt transporter (NicO) family protein